MLALTRRFFLLSPLAAVLARHFSPRIVKAQTTPDFHLQSTSPAIAAGVSLAIVTTDFDGNPRPNLPACGAYEYVSSTGQPPQPPTAVKIK